MGADDDGMVAKANTSDKVRKTGLKEIFRDVGGLIPMCRIVRKAYWRKQT